MYLNILLYVKELKHIRKFNNFISLFILLIFNSDWPTIPQLYVNGEFIGGCDIVTSLYQDGELVKMFKDLKLIDPSQV